MDNIMENVLGSNAEDEPRFRKIIQQMIDDNEVV